MWQVNFIKVGVSRTTCSFGVAFCTFGTVLAATFASRCWWFAVRSLFSVRLYGGRQCLLQFVSVLSFGDVFRGAVLVLAHPRPEQTFVYFSVFSIHDICKYVGHPHSPHG